MSLSRFSLVAALITAFFLPTFAVSQEPDDKEVPDIAKIRHEWFYGPRRDPQGHTRGDLRLKALKQAEELRKNPRPATTGSSSTMLAPTSTTMSATTANSTTVAGVDLTSSTWQPIGPQPMSNGGFARS